jgi:transposase
MNRKQDKPRHQGVDLDSLEQINLNAAGLDIGAEEIYASVPKRRDSESVRCFKTFSADVQALTAWLIQCGVTTVAMESTGVYWIPIYEVLAGRGFEVYLVNARHIKNVSGRKSDVLDCQWIQQLHTYGLLQASFRPSEDICTLRALVRQRDMLISYRSGHTQHMQKALEQMNLKLTEVVADITGLTGMTIMRAILRGERDPKTLAGYRHPACAKSEEEIARALEGHYRDEHVFALKQAVELYDFYTQQIQACDEQIEARYSDFAPQVDIIQNPLPPSRQRLRPGKDNAPTFDLRTYLYQMCGVDLTQIEGVNVLTAQKVISEIGLDMSKWRTVKHFTSWLNICPNNQITGGKVKKRGRKKAHNNAAQALRMAAQSLNRSQSALGAYYRRMRAKHGPEKANVCAAHKIARIIYFMLKNKTSYRDIGVEQYEEKYRQRQIRNLQRQAQRLGFRLEPASAQRVVS